MLLEIGAMKVNKISKTGKKSLIRLYGILEVFVWA
jgi:hypothetical protein